MYGRPFIRVYVRFIEGLSRSPFLVFADSTRGPDTTHRFVAIPATAGMMKLQYTHLSSDAVKSECSSFPRYRALGATLVEQLVVRRITESDHQI